MAEPSTTFQLLEPSDPESLVPASPLEPWMGVVLALLVGGLILFAKSRKNRQPPPLPSDLRNRAYTDALATLQAISPDLPPRETAVATSLTLRNYLVIAAGDPSLFETHPETLSRHDAFASFSPEARSTALDGLARLAELKYANDSAPATTTAALLTQASSLLETLHHGFTA